MAEFRFKNSVAPRIKKMWLWGMQAFTVITSLGLVYCHFFDPASEPLFKGMALASFFVLCLCLFGLVPGAKGTNYRLDRAGFAVDDFGRRRFEIPRRLFVAISFRDDERFAGVRVMTIEYRQPRGNKTKSVCLDRNALDEAAVQALIPEPHPTPRQGGTEKG